MPYPHAWTGLTLYYTPKTRVSPVGEVALSHVNALAFYVYSRTLSFPRRLSPSDCLHRIASQCKTVEEDTPAELSIVMRGISAGGWGGRLFTPLRTVYTQSELGPDSPTVCKLCVV